jgi:hypothetical protein
MKDLNEFYCTLEGKQVDKKCKHSLVDGCLREQNPCCCLRYKWPTPEQFEIEQGRPYGDKEPVWVKDPKYISWAIMWYETARTIKNGKIVCASTPYGQPPKDYSPF